MGLSLVWGDIWSFAVMEYNWSCDSGIFWVWWPKVMSPYRRCQRSIFSGRVETELAASRFASVEPSRNTVLFSLI